METLDNSRVTPRLKEIVFTSVVEAMEPIGFMEVIPSEDYIPYNMAIDRMRVDILVKAPFVGEIRLILPRSLGETITNNLYSINREGITDGELRDLLAEVLNVIAGRMLGKLVDPSVQFQIGLPEVGEQAFLDSDSASACFHFDMEGASFWLVLKGDGFFE